MLCRADRFIKLIYRLLWRLAFWAYGMTQWILFNGIRNVTLLILGWIKCGHDYCDVFNWFSNF